MKRRLLNVLAGVSLLLCLAALALWVRSRWATDWVWMRPGNFTAEVMTARNGCLFHWTGGGSDPYGSGRYGRRWYRDSTDPSDLIRGNWSFWTASQPHKLLGVVTWGRYRGKGSGGYAMSILVPYWLLACVAAAAGTGPLMISRRLYRRERRRSGRCATCGYDLRATPGRCPECGTVVKENTNSN